MKKIFLVLSAFVLMAAGSTAQAENPKSDQKIERGKKVSIEYLLRLADGSVADTNVGKEPLTYIQGSGQIIIGLERQLEGLKAGDARKIEVSPREGYGEFDPSAKQEIPKSSINNAQIQVGAKLYSRDNYGRTITATIKEIKKDSVVIDLNHPLAGKTLYFEVKVLKVEDAAPAQKPVAAPAKPRASAK